MDFISIISNSNHRQLSYLDDDKKVKVKHFPVDTPDAEIMSFVTGAKLESAPPPAVDPENNPETATQEVADDAAGVDKKPSRKELLARAKTAGVDNPALKSNDVLIAALKEMENK